MDSATTLPSAADERYPIHIRRDGVWLYHGSPIGRIELVRLFASVLRRDDSGDYWLITPVERGRITVDDAPFVGVELISEGEILKVRTNIDQWITLDAAHPLRMRNGVPYTELRPGIDVRLNQALYYQLADMATEINGNFCIKIAGETFVLGSGVT